MPKTKKEVNRIKDPAHNSAALHKAGANGNGSEPVKIVGRDASAGIPASRQVIHQDDVIGAIERALPLRRVAPLEG